jgi:glycosyltransferase involved in cell wall biosynthesis
MISVITCSIKPDVCKRMQDSVLETIGTEHEIIVFDNREKKYGICKAYNEAAKSATGDYLCFVHEDIEIKTKDWGKELVDFARGNESCGVIGLAGTNCVLKNFTGWWSAGTHFKRIYVLTNNNEFAYSYSNPNDEVFSSVICIDGVFMFIKKVYSKRIDLMKPSTVFIFMMRIFHLPLLKNIKIMYI